jgi:hypothetical protein
MRKNVKKDNFSKIQKIFKVLQFIQLDLDSDPAIQINA